MDEASRNSISYPALLLDEKSLLGFKLMDRFSTPPPKWSEKVTFMKIRLFRGATVTYFDTVLGATPIVGIEAHLPEPCAVVTARFIPQLH